MLRVISAMTQKFGATVVLNYQDVIDTRHFDLVARFDEDAETLTLHTVRRASPTDKPN